MIRMVLSCLVLALLAAVMGVTGPTMPESTAKMAGARTTSAVELPMTIPPAPLDLPVEDYPQH